ncbi:MAG TPA: hypothetical protein PLP33_25245 [Leptospiraceae bacterium]|nr:hypothetical protein [Leptospiraceae bacterium]
MKLFNLWFLFIYLVISSAATIYFESTAAARPYLVGAVVVIGICVSTQLIVDEIKALNKSFLSKSKNEDNK